MPQVGDGAGERRAIAAKGSKAHELRSFNYSHDFNDYDSSSPMMMMVMFDMYRCAGEEFEEKDLEDCFQAMCEDIMRERKRVGHHK